MTQIRTQTASDWVIDENQSAPLTLRGQLGFLPGGGGCRKQPGGNTKSFLVADRSPGIAMETAETDLDPAGVAFPHKVACSAPSVPQITVTAIVLCLLHGSLRIPQFTHS